jgi:hypothetical protein
LKGQRFRWCFGGIQILRRHWRLMLPGRPNARNRMSGGQRWAYLSGALQWYGDLVALLFYVFLLVGAANVALGGGLLFRKLTGFLLAAIPLLVLLGFVRAVALLRRGTGASWRDAFGAFMIWQATGLVVARASVQGLFAKEAEFLRTPKTAGEAKWWDAIRGNLAETALALLGVIGIVGSLAHPSGYGAALTAALLVWPTVAYGGAPVNSLSAQRAALPPELRARRRTESERVRTARRVTFAAAGMAAVGAAAAVAIALLSPGNSPVRTPSLLQPARGQHAQAPSGPGHAPGGSPKPSAATQSGSAPPSSSRPTSSSAPSASTAPASSSLTPSTRSTPSNAPSLSATSSVSTAP